MARHILIALFFVTAASALTAQAQERMRFQGRLTDAASTPVTTSTSVIFNFYNTPTGGTSLWTETHSGANAITPNANGLFTVELGSVAPISGVDFSQPAYLGITVSTDAEMTPRHLLTASGFAHHAKDSNALGGLSRAGFAELGGATFTGGVSATVFTGSGSGLTNLAAGELTGTLPALNASALTNVNAITLGGLSRAGFAELGGATFTGGVSATVFAGSGSGLTSIPASQLTGVLPALDGSALNALNASALTSGTLPDGRLSGVYTSALSFTSVTSANIGTLDAATILIATRLQLPNTPGAAMASNAGSIRYSGGKVQYSNGTAWTDIGSGGTPPGALVFSDDPNNAALLGAGYTRAPEMDARTVYGNLATEAPSARVGHTALWTGNLMLVWGGRNLTFLNTGGRYDPVTGTWTAITPSIVGPLARERHTAIWTGTRMLIWGGNDTVGFDTGASYDPVTDTWTAINTAGAPSARHSHTAVWTGSRMLVWGGSTISGSPLNSGGSYDPATDSWTLFTITGAPSARLLHGAVWTGSQMIVWGGEVISGYTSSGARYNPATDSWSSITATGAPVGRAGHTTLWTGSRILVWGGYSPTYQNTGGSYDPGTDSWTPINLSGAPTARYSHTALWTGSRMLIWGGTDGSSVNTGARYDPATDTWAPIAAAGAPVARETHSAVWSGSEMIVWGGGNSVSQLSNGGRYLLASNKWPAVVVHAYRAP